MAGEWRDTSLGELCDDGLAELQTGPFGSQLHAHDYTVTGIAVVPTEAIRNRRIDHTVLPKISRDKAKSLERHLLRKGDILFARRGAQATGHTGYVREAEDGFICGTGAIRLRIRDRNQKIRSEFMSHVLANPASVAWFKFHAIGATMPNLNEGIIRSFAFRFPSVEEQDKIAAALSALDDKIELNRQMNETLEGMDRALFKSWFVDFDPVRVKAEGSDPRLPKHVADLFPSTFEESDLGETPKGWETVALGDLLTLDKGISYKGAFLGTGFPMVNLGCFLGSGRFSNNAIKRYSGEFQPRHTVRTGDLVIANTDITQKRSVIGSPALVPAHLGSETVLFTHHVFAARFHKDTEHWKVFVYFLLLQEGFRERAAGFATGTTVLALPRDTVLSMQCTAPPTELIASFERFAKPLLEKQCSNVRESETLGHLRDALLPKLISGEVRLPDAERIVGGQV